MPAPIGPGGFPITNEGLPYIHLHQANYLKQLDGMPDKFITDDDIVKMYQKQKRAIASRLKSTLKLKSVEEGRNILKEAIALYNAGYDHKNGMEESLKEGAMRAVDRIRTANPNFKYKYGLSSTFKYLYEDVKGVQSAIDELNEIVKTLESLDANLVHYYSQDPKSPFSSFGGSGLKLLSVDDKSQTSFLNLKKQIEKLEAVAATGGNGGKLDPVVTVKMPDGSTEQVKTKGVLWGMHQRLINIQGTILEAVGLATLESAEKEIIEYVKSILGDNVEVSIEADASGSTYDELLGRMVTNTSDFAIKITKDGTTTNLGLSAKSQYKTGPKKTKSTTFKTTTVNALLRRGDLLNTAGEYSFLNDITFGRWKHLGISNIRRYMAAAGAYDAIGGTAGGDETYLLVYLDKIMTVEEFFDDIITSKNFLDIDIKNDDKVGKKNKIISFGRKSIKRLGSDDGGISNPNIELAYMRSKALQLLIHEMEAQIQMNYK